MPRRAKAKRLTRNKKSSKISGDPGTLTKDEWDTMTPFGCFVVTSSDGEEFRFKQRDDAIVMPKGAEENGLEEYEYWIAKIKEIRSSPTGNVWAYVQWYWSGKDVSDLIKSFDVSRCGRYERIFSDMYDYVHSSSFNGVTTVKRYDEVSVEQAEIGDGEFFCRYTLEWKIRRLDPKQIGDCICRSPYNPEDRAIMHFCPRPACRCAYHRDCLLRAGYLEPPSSDRDIRVLACSPDTNSNIFVTDSDVDPDDKAQEDQSTEDSWLATLIALIPALPPELVELAQQPILKGGDGDNGIVGNVRSVVAARRIVYDAVCKPDSLPENWRELVDMTSVNQRPFRKQAIPPMICPRCMSPI